MTASVAMVVVLFWSVCLYMFTFFISSSRYHVFVHVCMNEVFLVILTFETGWNAVSVYIAFLSASQTFALRLIHLMHLIMAHMLYVPMYCKFWEFAIFYFANSDKTYLSPSKIPMQRDSLWKE